MAADPFMGTGREPSVREVLDSGAARVERSLSDQPGIRAELLEVIATSYLSLGRQNDARRLLEEALRLRPMEAREGEPHYLSVQRALAAVAQEQGDWQVAERLYGDLVNERRRILGPKSNVLARTLNSQAKLLSAMGRDREAEPLLREALAIDSILMDPHHLSQSFNNLGNVLIAEGRYDAAEGMHRRAYLLRHTALGDSSAETGNSLVRLAVTRAEQGDPADADSLIRQGIAIKRRVLGPLHPDVLDDERTYGRVLQRIGRLAEAEVVYRGALEHGVARPDLVLWRAEVLAGLGGVILDRGDAQRARPVLQQAFEMQSKLLPPQHWKRAMTERALGVCLARLGNTSAAEPLLAEALTILESSRGYDDARSVRVRKELAALRAGQ
jgi:tetratricopeptide (TPR) repeat protein